MTAQKLAICKPSEMPKIELNRQRRLCAADLVAGLLSVGLGRVLASGEFPAPGRLNGVGDVHRSQCAGVEV
jgi:hypothetical protein